MNILCIFFKLQVKSAQRFAPMLLETDGSLLITFSLTDLKMQHKYVVYGGKLSEHQQRFMMIGGWKSTFCLTRSFTMKPRK